CDFITKDNSQYIQVTVRDEGVGIDPRDLDAIFVKFEQGTKTKTKSGGTGLGLAICQDIILLHDGKIWATNNPECGSSFTFTIPFYDKSNASNTS
ncbi:MAG: ATP-binding protein, partial [Rickettsiales bacterium]|nr:ATP-binding protein [Rickettsiales bacterium]